MANTYTVLSQEESSDFYMGEGSVSGILYTVELSNGTKTETQKYFVRNDQSAEDVLTEAANLLGE